ncbi:MAG: hypothetical protein C6W57_00260 [Caldibacillus debilis]|nr:MAG: hypothetical protein C6W57_00260 [Caldibacillus debilis]
MLRTQAVHFFGGAGGSKTNGSAHGILFFRPAESVPTETSGRKRLKKFAVQGMPKPLPFPDKPAFVMQPFGG